MQKYLRKFLLCCALVFPLGSVVSFAQQQAAFTQYMFNGLALNPAYAGSHGSLSATALARRQWFGFDGTASTGTFSLHSPILDKNIAVGTLLLHDRIGVTDQTGFNLAFAYQIRFPKGILSMGAQGGFTSYRARLSQLLVMHPNDPNFSGEDVNRFLPNVGTGFYYYTDRLYVGLSVPQLLNHYYNPNIENGMARQVRHYFLTGGYVVDLSPDLKLKPSLLVKLVEGAPVQADFNANLLIKDVIWIGASYRSFESIDALLELQLSSQLKFGYAYDFATSRQVRSVTGGSHEMMLNYRFSFSKTKLITPRYF
jgi:type IX secretion system PorP/SprF family membrane protein